jgi:cation transport ATPase
VTSLAVSTTTIPSFSAGYEFEILIGVIIILGIVRGLSGRKYSAARVLRTPAIYILFTAFAIFFSSTPNLYAQSMILLLPVGIPVGMKFGKDVKFFKRDDVLYYRRSPYILLLWALALIARVSLEFFSLHSLLAIIVFNALLSFITGMLLGEAIHILTKRRTQNFGAEDFPSGFNGERRDHLKP